jgi:hypothetical protein
MGSVAKRHNIALFLCVCVASVGVTSPVWAQGPGVRGGMSVNPEQIFFGGHYETAALVEQLHFKPNLEIGFGDNVNTVTANFEFVWKFPAWRDWVPYAGGGPAFVRYGLEDVSESGAGVNLLVGAEWSRGLAFEVKIGTLDAPDVKFGVGWTFK